MKVVLDTSAWYAYVRDEDLNHVEAKKFLHDQPELVILSTVLEELMALLHKRHGKQEAVKSGEVLRVYGVYLLTGDDEASAWKLFVGSSAKFPYVDCTVVAVALRLGLPVFGFDRDFKKLNVEVVPYEN